MSTTRETVPVATEIDPDHEYYYERKDGVLRSPSDARRFAMQKSYADDKAYAQLINAGYDRIPSQEHKQSFEAAHAFVRDLTGLEPQQVVFATSTARYEAEATFDAESNTVRLMPLLEEAREQLSPRGFTEYSTGLMVHELMHATGMNNARIINIDDVQLPQVTSGMFVADARRSAADSERNQNPRLGSFWEEAAAEEAAARWRETQNECNQAMAHELYEFDGLPPLEMRYITVDWASESQDPPMACAIAAIPAQTVAKLSKHTGVDLFGLMVEARQGRDHEAAAKRTFIQTVESVQKGLYGKLRDLEYTEEDFIEGYERVERAIADDKTRRLGAAAVAEEYADA